MIAFNQYAQQTIFSYDFQSNLNGWTASGNAQAKYITQDVLTNGVAQVQVTFLDGNIKHTQFYNDFQPISKDECSGMSASFTVLADGVYQWQKNNVDISGANSSQLIINNVQFSDAGTYKVTGEYLLNLSNETFNVTTKIIIK